MSLFVIPDRQLDSSHLISRAELDHLSSINVHLATFILWPDWQTLVAFSNRNKIYTSLPSFARDIPCLFCSLKIISKNMNHIRRVTKAVVLMSCVPQGPLHCGRVLTRKLIIRRIFCISASPSSCNILVWRLPLCQEINLWPLKLPDFEKEATHP